MKLFLKVEIYENIITLSIGLYYRSPNAWATSRDVLTKINPLFISIPRVDTLIDNMFMEHYTYSSNELGVNMYSRNSVANFILTNNGKIAVSFKHGGGTPSGRYWRYVAFRWRIYNNTLFSSVITVRPPQHLINALSLIKTFDPDPQCHTLDFDFQSFNISPDYPTNAVIHI